MFFGQLDDFDQDVNIGEAVNIEGQNVIISGSADHKFTANISANISVTNEKTVDVRTYEKCFTDRIDRETVFSTVDKKIQKWILTAIDDIITWRVELAVQSMNGSSEWVGASVTAIQFVGTYIDQRLFWKRIR